MAFSSGIIIGFGGAAFAESGVITLTLVEASSNTWAICGNLALVSGGDATEMVAGYKSLAGTLDSLTFKMTNGTDAFDSGSVIVVYE